MGSKSTRFIVLLSAILAVVAVVSACSSKSADTKIINIVRYPEPSDFGTIREIRSFPEKPDKNLGFDVRSVDLSSEDMSGRLNDLLYTTYDSKTKWPSRMPEGFNPKEVMEIYKNPGLNVRKLHEKGITGKGVGIGIIDQTLLVDHIEYKDRIKLYEENEMAGKYNASMHGSAVASIAVGKSSGVAPEADVYYIAGDLGVEKNGIFEYDFTSYAKNIDRILEINKNLPEGNKIRVISVTVGWDSGQKGYKEIMEAVNRAKEEGILIVSSSLEATYGYKFHGLGKLPLSDADDFKSYVPGSWWKERAEGLFRNSLIADTILMAPMDFRCTAAPNGTTDYVVYSSGGWSWTIPYITGVYALACQADPSITYDEFWSIALETGKSVTIKGSNGQAYEMRKIIDPVGIIDELEQRESNK